jgi:nicotinamidase-related amidase
LVLRQKILRRFAAEHDAFPEVAHLGEDILHAELQCAAGRRPDPQDPQTQLNSELVGQLDDAERIVVAGEASSHCVRATVERLAELLPSGHLDKLVLLSDCMSPVPGFEKEAETFLSAMRTRGATVCTSREGLRMMQVG